MNLPDDISHICDSAFSGCVSLEKISLPSVRYLQRCAFQNGTSLTELDVSTAVSIERGAFYDCKSLERVILPDDGLREINEGTCHGCKALKHITIPKSVTFIGFCAFQNCTSLTEVVIPEGVSEIGIQAFCGCKSLASVTLPKKMPKLGTDAFKGCKCDPT